MINSFDGDIFDPNRLLLNHVLETCKGGHSKLYMNKCHLGSLRRMGEVSYSDIWYKLKFIQTDRLYFIKHENKI
jgi:hypothetical protein